MSKCTQHFVAGTGFLIAGVFSVAGVAIGPKGGFSAVVGILLGITFLALAGFWFAQGAKLAAAPKDEECQASTDHASKAEGKAAAGSTRDGDKAGEQ